MLLCECSIHSRVVPSSDGNLLLFLLSQRAEIRGGHSHKGSCGLRNVCHLCSTTKWGEGPELTECHGSTSPTNIEVSWRGHVRRNPRCGSKDRKQRHSCPLTYTQIQKIVNRCYWKTVSLADKLQLGNTASPSHDLDRWHSPMSLSGAPVNPQYKVHLEEHSSRRMQIRFKLQYLVHYRLLSKLW